jgi:hypothetical protein
MQSLRLLWLVVVLSACGASSRNDPDGGQTPDAAPPSTAVVKGTVWAPGNAPGMVPTGNEIPVAGAVVYAVVEQPAPIPSTVYCDRCTTLVGYHAITDARGTFNLQLPAGHFWLEIEKGQFRREQELTIADFQTIELTTEQATLPSDLDPAHGEWVPHMALAVGRYDSMQDILAKLGLGTVDDAGVLTSLAPSDNIDLYTNGGNVDDSIAFSGTFDGLLGNLEQMKRYHIIFVPCTDNEFGGGLAYSPIFHDPQIRQNIRDYVAAGGKFYVTDWSAEWEDVSYPDFLTFETQDSSDPACVDASCGNGDGNSQYTSMHAHAVDDDLGAWLDGQKGPVYVPGSNVPVAGTIDADDFIVLGAWDRITNLGTVTLGNDSSGNPVLETPTTWVSGDEDGAGDHPLTVTFEPGGCGRVVYSTYHTADTTHVGLVPQERILAYLVMEIGVCSDEPVIE